MTGRDIVFVVNLLQDINIIRPLAIMAFSDLQRPVTFLVTHLFRKRDITATWQQELYELSKKIRAEILEFEDEFQALHLLHRKSGLLIASSESHLNAHKPVHDLFRVAPSYFLKITLQHGFECVGFLQSRDHDMAHGKAVTFAADIVCGWSESERLLSMVLSQRHKLMVTGPTQALRKDNLRQTEKKKSGIGIVCENMHSVRLNVAGDFKQSFLEIFAKFSEELKRQGKKVALRPHPGGQYTLKNKVPLAGNVIVNNEPIYKVDLSRYAYGISAPSSVLIDMMLAGIPVAVWQDGGSIMDLGNYAGLTRISSLQDWLEFTEKATSNPEYFLDIQQKFMERQKLVVDPAVVHKRYVALLGMTTHQPRMMQPSSLQRERVLFVANSFVPTLQLSFVKPLAPLIASGEMVTELITEDLLKKQFPDKVKSNEAVNWIKARLQEFHPTQMVFCRYSGPHYQLMHEWAVSHHIPTIYHIDDDLLNIPDDIGTNKFEYHNRPGRLSSVRYLLDNVTLVYGSTKKLVGQLESMQIEAPKVAGAIYCSGRPLVVPAHRPVRKIGYMASRDHAHNLAVCLRSVSKLMKMYTEIEFEFFGSIPVPDEFRQFGDRIKQAPKIDNYEEFLTRFAEREWDIGICPLTPIHFNLMKANTKWVEYTSVGIAVVASNGTVYDECCADGCGLLAGSEDEWFDALESLILNPEKRHEMVVRAQEKLVREYSTDRLREQVLDMFSHSKRLMAKHKLKSIASLEEERGGVQGSDPFLRLLDSDNRGNDFHQRERMGPARILFVANGMIPTLQLSFIKPLAALIESGQIVLDFVTETSLQTQFNKAKSAKAGTWVKSKLAEFYPAIVVFCRYNGPHYQQILNWAEKHRVPTLYHIDDDLLNIPEDIGMEKFISYNRPERLSSVRYLLDNVTMVYGSTKKLVSQLESMQIEATKVAGAIYCSGRPLVVPAHRPVRKIGYMGIGHEKNLASILPALIRLLDKHAQLEFEFFGSIPVPDEFRQFGDRIKQAPKIDNYEEFLTRFAEREWDIGICPLTPIHFNLMKANTKWVEYTSVGIAVVASNGTVYDECCADGCGLLAGSEDEWFDALESLILNPEKRHEMVVRAQEKLVREYSTDRLREQVLDMLSRAYSMNITNRIESIKARINSGPTNSKGMTA